MNIKTDRLIIRSFALTDIDDYATIVADPRVTRYLKSSAPHSIEEAAEYIQSTIAEEARTGIVRYAVTLKESGKLIGFCGFKETGDAVDFGWRYGYESWSKGYGSEAAIAVMEYGKEVLQLSNIFSVAQVENIASVKIIKKLGYREHEFGEIDGIPIVRFFNLTSGN